MRFFENTAVICILLTVFCCAAGTVNFLYKLWNRSRDKRHVVWSFIISVVLCILSYGCLAVCSHYSVDSFNVYFDMSPYWHFSIGRYVNGSIILLAQKFGVNQVSSQRLFIAVWMISVVFMWMMFTDSLTRHMHGISLKGYLASAAAVSLSFVNVFAMELMLFPEMAMVLFIGNSALGLSVHVLSGDGRHISRWLAGVCCLLIATGCYQSYMGIFEIFVLTGIFIKERTQPKKRYLKAAAALLAGGLASVWNVVHVKILMHMGIVGDSGRGAALDFETILENLKGLAVYQLRFWKDADGLMLPAVMPLCGVCILVIIVSALKGETGTERKIFLLMMIGCCYLLGFAPHIIEDVLTLTPRSNIAVWSVLAAVFVIGIFDTQDVPVVGSMTAAAAAVLILLGNICTMTDMAANERAVNAVDLMEAGQIADKVLAYEQETGNAVIKMASAGDGNATYYWPESRYQNNQLGARILCTDYSDYRLIGYVLGRSMEKTDMPEEIYASYFAGKDWNTLNVSEQAVCIGDTLYLAVY